MKKLLFGLLLCALSCVFSSCDKEDDEIGEENIVTWEILASDANALIDMFASNETIHASSGYKYTYKTTAIGATCRVSCKDYYNKLTLKGYVNGKLKIEESGNGFLQVSLDIK